ncbi:MAG: phosphoribosylglycinamide synthetase C domain-containing protein [bacterium]
MQAVANEKLSSFGKLSWHSGAAACVIMASKGYPGKYSKGALIQGLDGKFDANTEIFHAGTEEKNGKLVTAGGRVLGVVARDMSLQLALGRVYRAINKIKFEGASFRRDIGFRATKPIAK